MNVTLHIERLVVDGLDVSFAWRASMAEALEQELGRLIGEGGLSPAVTAGFAAPRVGAPAIAAARVPRQMGAAIAGAVYAGLQGGRP